MQRTVLAPEAYRDPTEGWRDFALCRGVDPELFFPDVRGSRQRAQALVEPQKVCNSCPVMEQCLAWATRSKQSSGVWGGHDFGRG